VQNVETQVKHQVRRWRLGGRVGVGLDPELLMFGVHSQMGPIFNLNVLFRLENLQDRLYACIPPEQEPAGPKEPSALRPHVRERQGPAAEDKALPRQIRVSAVMARRDKIVDYSQKLAEEGQNEVLS